MVGSKRFRQFSSLNFRADWNTYLSNKDWWKNEINIKIKGGYKLLFSRIVYYDIILLYYRVK